MESKEESSRTSKFSLVKWFSLQILSGRTEFIVIVRGFRNYNTSYKRQGLVSHGEIFLLVLVVIGKANHAPCYCEENHLHEEGDDNTLLG